MLVNIEFGDDCTLIKFKARDMTSLEDLQQIGCAIANSYCFEAMSLFSEDFESFVASLKPRSTYELLIGLDDQDGQPKVQWRRI